MTLYPYPLFTHFNRTDLEFLSLYHETSYQGFRAQSKIRSGKHCNSLSQGPSFPSVASDERDKFSFKNWY